MFINQNCWQVLRLKNIIYRREVIQLTRLKPPKTYPLSVRGVYALPVAFKLKPPTLRGCISLEKRKQCLASVISLSYVRRSNVDLLLKSACYMFIVRCNPFRERSKRCLNFGGTFNIKKNILSYLYIAYIDKPLYRIISVFMGV